MRRLIGLSALGLMGVLPLVASGCGDDTTTGGGGSGASTPTGGGGSGQGGNGGTAQGGMPQGGSGGMAQGGGGSSNGGSGGTGGTGVGGTGVGGTGGTGVGGTGVGGTGVGGTGVGGTGGTGGGMAGTENCANNADDDGDLLTDCADPDCATTAVCGDLVINEVDYDQVAGDNNEFVEIFNRGASDVDLTGVQLLLANGAANPPAVYRTVDLTGTLPSGSYAVVASSTVVPAPNTLVFTFPAASNNIQNGTTPNGPPGDAVALFDTTTSTMLDRFSYEGGVLGVTVSGTAYDFIEGNLVAGGDSDTLPGSFSRVPNGADTDDNATDWLFVSAPTPGGPNMATEICNNGSDDDGDTFVDCLDSDCSSLPLCAEICNDTIDNNMNGQIDCAEASCDTQTCDMFGRVCLASACTCPGGNTESACGNGSDDDCDGNTDCADSDCSGLPSCSGLNIQSVDYPVIAQGGKLVITGAGFTNATLVTIGGISETFTVNSDTQITIASVGDTTPIGVGQPLVVSVNASMSNSFSITPIRLQINELDADQVGTDAAEFIEVSTGVPNVNLTGYTIVFFNGSNDLSYFALDMNATTDANGLLLVGNSGLNPPLVFTNNFLQNGQDAVALYQAAQSAFPNNTAVTNVSLIDALVYDTADADDPGLLAGLLGAGPQAVQVDEGMNPTSETQSIKRCGDGRLDGRRFVTTMTPSPGQPNGVVCP
ncbi:MAG: lamin tail domain-containing protein [Polyangiaceae bacterium]